MSNNNIVLPGIGEHTSRFSEVSTPAERSANQQRIIAELGTFALSGAAQDELMAKMTQWVCDGLGTRFCNILQVLSGEERLLLRASYGLAQEQVGTVTAPRTTNTQAVYTMATDQPVIVEDFASETRFDGPTLMARDEVTSGISVIVYRGQKQPWGVLTAHTREYTPFAEEDVAFVQGVANVLGLVLEHAKQEEERWRIERMLQNVMDNSSAVVFVKEQDGKYVFVNREYEKVFGLTRERVALGVTDYDIFAAETADILRANDRQVIQNRKPISVEEEIPYGGVTRTYISLKFPLISSDGELFGIGVVATDISERKVLEAALWKAEGRVRMVVDSALDGIILIDTKGRIETANPAAVKMFGYESGELVGQNVKMLMPEPYSSAHDERLHNYHTTSIKRIIGKPREVAGRRKDGTTFPLDIAVTEAVNDHGGFVGTLRDLTDRKQMEEQLLHAQKMDSIGRLAGGVAHDYNNLLSVIIGFGELVEEGLRENDALLPMVKNILNAAEKAATLTQQLLAFARKQTQEPHIVSANPLLEEVAQLLRPIIGTNIEMVILFDEEDGRVFLDPGQLEQVLVNLAVNARDAMPQGGKLILQTQNIVLTEPRMTDKSSVPPGAYVVVSVTDTGQGMSRAVQARMFEPFFTTKEPGKGTGLGLATVYGIVHQANGHLCVDSKEGVGTTFKVYLPRQDSEQIGAPPREDDTRLQGDELILVVEDEPLVRELIVGTLKRNGYSALVAENGQHALRVLSAATRTPDLLITDAIMPLMGGRELIERFRKLHPTIPVIISSGYSEEGWASQPQTLPQGIDFVQKPFTSRTLLERIRQTLDAIR